MAKKGEVKKVVQAPPMPTVRRIFPTALRTNPVKAIHAELRVLATGLSYVDTKSAIARGRMI